MASMLLQKTRTPPCEKSQQGTRNVSRKGNRRKAFSFRKPLVETQGLPEGDGGDDWNAEHRQ